MVDIKVYRVIANEQENIFFKMFGSEEEMVFSAESINRILSENKDETEFRLNIHCDGGSTEEGFAIYDTLRTSGKTLFANIDGGCHSMATILLLAAPKENRTANPNARALIHEVRAGAYGTIDEMQAAVELAKAEQERILDVYVERTGYDRTKLEEMMKAERYVSAKELLNLGFISKINTYSTNQKPKAMAKNEIAASLLGKIDGLSKAVKNLLTGAPVNYDFNDADGNLLFSTEKEDDSLAVGDAASPDGVFVLEDGRTVTIAEGAITEIADAPEEAPEDVAQLTAQVSDLTAQVEALKGKLQESVNLLTEARALVASNAVIATRQTQQNSKPGAKGPGKLSFDQLKTEAREKRAKMQGGTK